MASFRATLQADCKNNPTGIQLVKGKKYRFSAKGTWYDAKIPSPPTGYELRRLALFKPLRRVPKAKWFSVIGNIDKSKATFFDIGSLIVSNKTYTAAASGELFCFANDVIFMYGNNSGSVELMVEEV